MNRQILLIGIVLALPHVVRAESLQDALAEAYRSNPALSSQRSAQRATNETAAQARSGWRPVVTATMNAGYARGPYDSYDFGAGTIESNDAEAAVSVTQPLYTGGRVANAVRAADTRVEAGLQGLRLAEAQTFQTVIQAYMDVLRDQDILAVRRADLATLERQVKETKSRYDLGDAVTETDVAQADAQRQQAVASLADAEADADASRAGYRAAVGTPPGALLQPDTLPGLPATEQQALSLADAANPALLESRLVAQASQTDIATARSAYFPTVGVQGSFGYIGPAAPFRSQSYDREVTGIVTLTQPLITGGLVASQVRQAKDRAEADRQSVSNTERQAEQTVLSTWSRMRNGFQAITANIKQVRSAEVALKGYQLEYGYGLRSTLDVLIADENLRAGQVSLAESRHDTVVAEADLLAAVGRLEARVILPQLALDDASGDARRSCKTGASSLDTIVATLDHGAQ